MKFVIGTKLQMTQMFDEEGIVHPVTIVGLEPLKVSIVRTDEKDGYGAVQVGYRGSMDKPKKHKEFKGSAEGYEVGKDIDSTEVFEPGDVVSVRSVSKGKGFQGVVKRYGFAGGPRTHGQKHNERAPGSIGSGLRSRVPKGQKMPGRMGSDYVTIKGTKVILIDKDKGLMMLKGSIPGRRGTEVEIKGI